MWRFDGSTARFESQALSAVVDVAAPHHGLSTLNGLSSLRYAGEVIAGSLLGVAVDDLRSGDAPSDAYVRGNDLVVAYRETEQRPFGVQVYWSVSLADDGSAIVDATTSIQTRQWEAYPRVAVTSTLAGSEFVERDETSILLRPAGSQWTYAELAMPGDFEGAHDVSACRSRWTFDGHFMERGVIRRLRVRGMLMARLNDVQATERAQAKLAVEQPPLTA
jgi:hypothetical protein